MSADGGDGEAGSAARPGGGEGSLLHLHWLPAACCGETQSDLLRCSGFSFVQNASHNLKISVVEWIKEKEN